MDRLPEALAVQRGLTGSPRGSAGLGLALKLALVSPYDFAYPGGVTQHVGNLAVQLRRHGHEVHIIAPSSADAPELPEPSDAFLHRIGRVVQVPANGSVARITLSLRPYWQAKTLLREQQYDLIHLHEPMMPALPLTVLRHSRSVNIGTFHAYGSNGLNYFYGKPILQPFYRKLHGHIAVSAPARDFVARHFPGDFRLIPNGIDFLHFQRRREPLARFADGRPNVLFVGRLEKRKGLRFLLRAWQSIRQRFPEARLVVVGGGRPLEGYRRFAQRQGWSDDDVHFAGFVSDEDLPRYYQAADVFCAPNTGGESFGIVLLEAMAAGVAVVASDIPGYRSVVTHGEEGLLAPAKDAEALASAIGVLLLNPEMRGSMSARGQAKARVHDWVRVAGTVLDYYHEVLEGASRAAPARGPRFARVRRLAGLLS